MKILIVSQYFFPEFFLVNNLATELKARGHKIEVLTGLPNYPSGTFTKGYSFFKGPWTEEHLGVQIHRVPLLPRRKGFAFLALNYLSFIFFGIVPGLFRAPKDFDVILCFGLSPVTACIPAIALRALRRKPMVFWVQDLWPESVVAVGAAKASFAVKLIGALVRWIYSRCDLILMQSEAFRESILRWGGDPKKLMYVPNWFDDTAVQTQVPDWVRSLPQGFKVIFAGNVGHAQDMPTLLKAAELLRNHKEIQWIVVGDGSAKTFLEEEARRLGLTSIHTLGRRPVNDMPALFKAGDLLLVSLTDQHIFSLTVPSKVQAYMASGRPILAALNGAGAKLVEESGAGLSSRSGDAQGLADKVLRFAKMTPNERQVYGQRGQDYFKAHFRQDLIVEKIEKICQTLIAGEPL